MSPLRGLSRRQAIGGAFGVLVLGALVAGIFVGVPRWLGHQVVAAAAERGLALEVGGVSIGTRQLRLLEVSLSGPGLEGNLGEVVLQVGLWDAIWRGSSAVAKVDVVGGTLAIDIEDEGLRRIWLDREAAGEERGGGANREVSVSSLRVHVVDRRGRLLAVEGLDARWRRDALRVDADSIELAPETPDGLSGEALRLELTRTSGSWLAERLAVRSVVARYRERSGGAENPLRTRLASHLRRWHPGGDEQDGEAVSDAPSRVLDPAIRGLERLAVGASLVVEDLEVIAEGDTTQAVLRRFETEITSLGAGRYRARGSGQPGSGGRLRYDMTVEPSLLRAEGDLELERLPFALLVPFLPRLPWYRPEATRVGGTLTIRSEGVDEIHIRGRATLEGLGLVSDRIAPRPVERIRVAGGGEAVWAPISRRLEVRGAEVELGDASASLVGSLAWPDDGYEIDLRATMPTTECSRALGAIPPDLLGDAANFAWTGSIGAQASLRVDSRDLERTDLQIRIVDRCRFAAVPALADTSRFAGPFTHRVAEPDGTIFEMEAGPGTATWTPLASVSPFLVHAVLGHEDAGFFRHEGFSVPSIRQALIRNLRAGRYAFGASTITMQLVKNLLLRREKTLARKVQEVILTWWIESALTKAEILELYLNVIEYGPSVYGVRAATRHYFACEPAELTPAQAAYLATILPNPKAFHTHREEASLPDSFRRRVARFLRTLGSRGRFDDEAVSAGLEELDSFRFGAGSTHAQLWRRGATAPLPVATAPHDLEAFEDEDYDPPFDEEESLELQEEYELP